MDAPDSKKLNLQADDAVDLEASPSRPSYLPDLAEGSNQAYPGLSSRLDVMVAKKAGRYVVAKEDINVGEILGKLTV